MGKVYKNITDYILNKKNELLERTRDKYKIRNDNYISDLML